MSWKQWTAVAVVIGGGILLQIAIPTDSMDMGGADAGTMQQGMTAPEAGPYRTVALDVTGMT